LKETSNRRSGVLSRDRKFVVYRKWNANGGDRGVFGNPGAEKLSAEPV